MKKNIDLFVEDIVREMFRGTNRNILAEDVKAGDVVTEKNVRSVRPGYGLHPKYLPEVLGKKFVKDCQTGERFSLELIDKSER